MTAPAAPVPSVRAMKAVYAFLHPEVAALVRELDAALDPTLVRNDTPAAALEAVVRAHVSPALAIPARPDGTLDLDALHETLPARVVSRYLGLVPGLDGLRWRYPTAGSSEGLFHLLAGLRARGVRAIRVLPGEYEGYAIQAGHVGLDVETVPLEDALGLPPDDGTRWFVSQPSARDGDLLPDGFVGALLDAGHRMVLDLSYVGAAAAVADHRIDAGHPGIEAVVLSLSKPFGLFRWRIGWTLAREPIPTLFSNRWFNDPGRQLLGLAAVERFGLLDVPRRLAVGHQAPIVARLSDELGIPLRAADVAILATAPAAVLGDLPAELAATLAPYRRADVLRLCLTPYLEERVAA